jgi:hypothetical protein
MQVRNVKCVQCMEMLGFSGKPKSNATSNALMSNHAYVITSRVSYPSHVMDLGMCFKVFKCHVMGHSNSLGVIEDSSKLPNAESPKVLKRRKVSQLTHIVIV